jgi:ribonuclease HII
MKTPVLTLFDYACGVDEAGRGPLAGEVYAAAVILHPEKPIIGINDSKKLSEKKRLYYAEKIKQEALVWAIASASVAEIDQLNILHATMLAMRRAIEEVMLRVKNSEADFSISQIVVDGNRLPLGLTLPAQAIVQGDAKVAAIAAASILAKTARDAALMQLDLAYPQYGFAQHKGYGTAVHLAALKEFGACPEHRRSYAPVRRYLTPEAE